MKLAALLTLMLLTGLGGGGKPCLPGAGTGPVATPGGHWTAYLTGVTAKAAGCADRVSLTFADRAPGYRIEYRPAAQAQTEDASGRHIPVAGRAFLVVRLADAKTARSHPDGSITKTYAGPRRVRVTGTRHVTEVVKTGDFEAVVTWAIGLDGKRPFLVHRSGRSIVIEVG